MINLPLFFYNLWYTYYILWVIFVELDYEKINEFLINLSNPLDKMFLYRLARKLETITEMEEKFSLVQVNTEFKAIVKKYNIVINSLIGDKLRERIDKHYNLIKILLQNIDIEDAEKIDNLKKEFVYLECMLDLPISYPKTAKDILNEFLNKDLQLKRGKNE